MINRRANPYRKSCNMSAVKSVELRNEKGSLIKVKDSKANIAVAFENKEIADPETKKEGVPTEADMMLVQVELKQPGASGVEIFLETEKQKNICVLVLSRKGKSPTLDEYDQKQLVRTKRGERRIIFTDLEMGDPDATPTHHLGFKVVKCGKSNTSKEYVMTSTVVESQLNLTFTLFMHACNYWNPVEKKWDGDGCKVFIIMQSILFIVRSQ